MRCEEIMKRNVACALPHDSVQAVARRMSDENIGFMPVCDQDNRPIGTITDRDIVVRIDATGRSASSCSAAEAMTAEVVSCHPEDDLARAEELMAIHKKSRILVTDDQGRVAGVISLSDIAQFEGPRRAGTMLRKIASREARL